MRLSLPDSLKDIKTQRLQLACKDFYSMSKADQEELVQHVIEILSPEVVKSLPLEWQSIKTHDDALTWIKDRSNESSLFIVRLGATKKIVGFMFLRLAEQTTHGCDLHLGYLLSQTEWNRGYGSELIKGLVNACRKFNTDLKLKPIKYNQENCNSIRSLTGGVDAANIGSIKVLKRNGFQVHKTESQDGNTLCLKLEFNTL